MAVHDPGAIFGGGFNQTLPVALLAPLSGGSLLPQPFQFRVLLTIPRNASKRENAPAVFLVTRHGRACEFTCLHDCKVVAPAVASVFRTGGTAGNGLVTNHPHLFQARDVNIGFGHGVAVKMFLPDASQVSQASHPDYRVGTSGTGGTA